MQILDLGCGQGRLLKRLVEWRGSRPAEMVGVDWSGPALDTARAAVPERAGLSFVQADILDYLRGRADESADMVLLVEVLFCVPDPAAILAQVGRVLRRGAIALVAFRPRHRYLLDAVRTSTWPAVAEILRSNSGRPWGGDATLQWCDESEARGLLTAAGLSVEAMYGVGSLSGIQHDPLSAICRPSRLDADGRAALLEAELYEAERLPGAGRYMLASARRS